MRVLIDTNIWIDLALRPDQFSESIKSYVLMEKLKIHRVMAASSYTTVYYLIKKFGSQNAAQSFFKSIFLNGVMIGSFSKLEIDFAWSLKFSDHEDACIASTAVSESCDLIVSRNQKDFKNSPVKCLLPIELTETILYQFKT